jgi:hypothetical protein
MLQQDKKIDESGYDELCRWLWSLTRRGNKKAARDGQHGLRRASLSEPVLVALAALPEVYGLDWRARLQPKGEGDLERMIRSATGTAALGWPPKAAELDAFYELLNGIKVSEG